jgi:ubiquinone/menaquinone biosynthesis C-methylase UbiE
MAEVTAFAGSVPANYDQYLGPVLFEPYALDIVARLNKSELKNVLELACGTGRVTRHLANVVPAGGKLVATDLNGDMINVARTIITDPKVQWLVVDAQELPFGDEAFDHIICQFGVMFFPDKAKAFAEAHRVLQTNGKFIFNVWDSLEYNANSAALRSTMENIMGADAPDFLSKGPFSFYDRHHIKNLLEGAGFKDINLNIVQKTSYYQSVDDMIKGFTEGSPLASYLAQQPIALQQTIKTKLRAQLVATYGETQIISPMQAIVVTAVK